MVAACAGILSPSILLFSFPYSSPTYASKIGGIYARRLIEEVEAYPKVKKQKLPYLEQSLLTVLSPHHRMLMQLPRGLGS